MDFISPTAGKPATYDLLEKTTTQAGAAAPVVSSAIQAGFDIGSTEEQALTASFTLASDTVVHTYQLEVRATAWKIPARVTTTEVLRTIDVVAGTFVDTTTVTDEMITGNDLIDCGTHTLPASVPGVTTYVLTVTHTIQLPVI